MARKVDEPTKSFKKAAKAVGKPKRKADKKLKKFVRAESKDAKL